ncbi:MAG: hypothetical protein KGJ13_08280 [Patescibacteria group bacterium]|nr:hypothetical protein [Patescibacteria group bacterium]
MTEKSIKRLIVSGAISAVIFAVISSGYAAIMYRQCDKIGMVAVKPIWGGYGIYCAKLN